MKCGVSFSLLSPQPSRIQKKSLRQVCAALSLVQSGTVPSLIQRLELHARQCVTNQDQRTRSNECPMKEQNPPEETAADEVKQQVISLQVSVIIVIL